MGKYELLLTKCRMCDWQWEITPQEQTENIVCEQCGSNDVIIEKETLHMHKQNGKFVTDIGFASPENRYGAVPIEEITDNYEKPLLVVKENNIRLPDDMTNEDRISILGKINSIKSRILQDIRESQDASFINLK